MNPWMRVVWTTTDPLDFIQYHVEWVKLNAVGNFIEEIHKSGVVKDVYVREAMDGETEPRGVVR